MASLGIASVSFACTKDRPSEPVGNLRPPDPTPTLTPTTEDAAAPLPHPVGNLRPPEPVPSVEAPPEKDAGALPHHPVGNLRPPPPPTKP